MSKGEYPIALDFNLEGGNLLPETPDRKDVGLWWSLYNTRCLLYIHTDNEQKLSTIIKKLITLFEVMSATLDENTLFCNSNQFYALLGQLNEFENQKIILEHFNKPEFKDELVEENLAQLNIWNGKRFLNNGELEEAIQSFELAASYATNLRMRSDAYCNIGNAYSRLGRFKEAISITEEAMVIDDREIEFWRIFAPLAHWCVEAKDYSKGIKYLKKSATVNQKLYRNNSLPEHFFFYLNSTKQEIMLGFNQSRRQYPPMNVFSGLGDLLKEGIREFKKTSHNDEFSDAIRQELLEICTICSQIDPQFYSNQTDRVQREWQKKQTMLQQESGKK
jgi:tetratricopeptide (TPR) repeat protein